MGIEIDEQGYCSLTRKDDEYPLLIDNSITERFDPEKELKRVERELKSKLKSVTNQKLSPEEELEIANRGYQTRLAEIRGVEQRYLRKINSIRKSRAVDICDLASGLLTLCGTSSPFIKARREANKQYIEATKHLHFKSRF